MAMRTEKEIRERYKRAAAFVQYVALIKPEFLFVAEAEFDILKWVLKKKEAVLE